MLERKYKKGNTFLLNASWFELRHLEGHKYNINIHWYQTWLNKLKIVDFIIV